MQFYLNIYAHGSMTGALNIISKCVFSHKNLHAYILCNVTSISLTLS